MIVASTIVPPGEALRREATLSTMMGDLFRCSFKETVGAQKMDDRPDGCPVAVTVTFDPDRTTFSAVARAITDAGFPAKARTNDG